MERIKIVRRQLNWSQITPPTEEPIEVYDIYEGFCGITSLFRTKWYVQKQGVTKEEMLKYMAWHLTTVGNIKIEVKYGGIQG